MQVAALESMDAVLGELVRRIVRHFQPEQIILFGSHARGTARPDSDVDLLVVLPANGSKRRQMAAIYGVLADLGIAKDVVVATPQELRRYADVPGLVIRTALQEGRVLYERHA